MSLAEAQALDAGLLRWKEGGYNRTETASLSASVVEIGGYSVGLIDLQTVHCEDKPSAVVLFLFGNGELMMSTAHLA